MATLIEEYRKQCVENLFATNTFNTSFALWKPTILNLIQNNTPQEFFDLADHLRNIFNITNVAAGRGQAVVSGGGACWEALVCWYLNLCNLGRRTIVIKHLKELIPECISNAITVNYGNFPSNTESDLIAITFPDRPEYNTEFTNLQLYDQNGHLVRLYKTKNGIQIPNIKAVIDILAQRDFSDLEINIIQCKTNWNDNAQIPMLWDMIYSANAFRTNITIGRNGYSITGVRRFAYSFVTVPSNRLNLYNAQTTCVKRVENLSGGNYWGCPTMPNVAASLKELLTRNLFNGANVNHYTTLANEIPNIPINYHYFGI